MDITKFKGQLSLSMRPHSLTDLHGCDDFKKAVLGYKKSGIWPVATLLQGRFGSGKTTAALIMTQMMNCKSPKEDGSPCCECASCKSIINNTYSNDVIFIDAASCSTADDLEALNLDEFIKMPSMQGNHKIIIVDEFQQITGNKASKIFLKLAETTKPKVHIIFTSMANITYDKKYEAIVSRCQKFFFGNKATHEDVMHFIAETLEKLELWNNHVENHFADDNSMFSWVEAIAASSKCSYRQAIQNLQSCIERDIFDPEEVRKEFAAANSSQHQALLDILNGNFTSESIANTFFNEDDNDEEDNIQKESLGQIFSYAYLEVADAYYYKTQGKLPPKYDFPKYKAARFYKEKELPELAKHANFDILLKHFRKISDLRREYLGKGDFIFAMCDLFEEIKGAKKAIPMRETASAIPTRPRKS